MGPGTWSLLRKRLPPPRVVGEARGLGVEPGTTVGALPRSRVAEGGARGPGVEPWCRGWSPGAGGGAVTQSPGVGGAVSSYRSDKSTQERLGRECAAASSWALVSALHL